MAFGGVRCLTLCRLRAPRLRRCSGDATQWLNYLRHARVCFLRRARQTRRDGEIQLHPLEQREADLSEELHRQKEKERLRKEYIEELKKRHEEEKNRLEALHLKEQAGRRDDQVWCSRPYTPGLQR